MKIFILLVACVAYASAEICVEVCKSPCKTDVTAAGAAISGSTAAALGTVDCGPSCRKVCDDKWVNWIGGLFGKRDAPQTWVVVAHWEGEFPRHFNEYDTNRDGRITHREFVNAINAELKDVAALKVFKLADKNGDDYIDRAELSAAPFKFAKKLKKNYFRSI